MDWSDILTKVLPASGLVGGIAGYFASWVNWGIEKRRMRTQRRQQLVDGWRRELLPKLEGIQDLGHGTRRYPFMRTPEYASLRCYRSSEFLSKLEGTALQIDVRTKDGHITEVVGD